MITYTDREITFVFAGIAIVASVVLVIWNVRIMGSAMADPLADSTTTTSTIADTLTASTTDPLADSTTTDSATTTSTIADTLTASTTDLLADSLTASTTTDSATTVSTTTDFTTAPLADSLTANLAPVTPTPANSIDVAPKGVSRLKVFTLTQDGLVSTVNSWLAVQKNIVVDQLNVQDYGGGGYLVVIGYHTGGAGNSTTRLKIIEGEHSETDAQAFLSALKPSQTVRSISAITGSYSGSQATITVPIIFIIYE